MNRKEIMKKIRCILTKHSIKEAYLFGSFARGEKYKDVDILIHPPHHFSLLDLVGLSYEIEDSIHIKADVVTKRSLDRHLRSYILRDLVAI